MVGYVDHFSPTCLLLNQHTELQASDRFRQTDRQTYGNAQWVLVEQLPKGQHSIDETLPLTCRPVNRPSGKIEYIV